MTTCCSVSISDEDHNSVNKQAQKKEMKWTKRKNMDHIESEEPTVPKVKKRRIAESRLDVKNKDCDNISETLWTDYELLADRMNLSSEIAKNVSNLFDNGSTIPFIARYRRNVTGNMSPELLREVKNNYDDICMLKTKIKTVLHSLQKAGHLNKRLENIVKSSKTSDELEIIYAPLKPEGKRTHAERAKALGLEQPALDLLYNTSDVDLTFWVNSYKEDLETLTKVEKGIIHIIAHKVATDADVLEFLREIRRDSNITIETKKKQSKQTGESKKKQISEESVDELKYKLYFDFKNTIHNIKPHQVLAINRGEHCKILSVKISIPNFVKDRFHQICSKKWINHGRYNVNRRRILEEAMQDSYIRLVHPLLVREIRTELNTMAEKASCDVFSKNLKQILLAKPIKGQTILGIDPGFAHGCKIAIISPTGIVLDHGVIYPHSSQYKKATAEKYLKNMLHKNNCSLIALGDATASKTTEKWLTDLIKDRYFHPIDVKYTIVSEDGSSVYSCSLEAKKEFPDLDTNVVSAISLARRIQDPMAELVKVEPRHLGIGMYQHDLKKKTLNAALDEVVSECVSFVGVDLNTASQCLLRRIAGLTDKRATEIVKYREKNGPFVTRKTLLKVMGIGPKVFEQCAGFLKICPLTSKSENNKLNKLDQTIIHPESYDITKKFLERLDLKIDDIGESKLIDKIKSIKTALVEISKELITNVETLDLICNALEKPLNYDLRCEFPQATFFSTGLNSINDLSIGSKVLGRVKNVTHFGCFVDIGVGKDGLIHCSKLNDFYLQIGDKIEGEICSLDHQSQRIGIKPLKKI
ncbi:S1 RNA-binding domain-containing protein 1 isoform X1 [Diorhabda carinulata]|uniref:S1 RNA-binding domain-containing protein 1 isoform X1 n=1 Tax=Diorhabda carinulata TaxID=1163345 RepID=UPI0025A0A719|nr:S1 RNA-binding domain-containing protein 1 isoform X1 [Diorhabda carinulata]